MRGITQLWLVFNVSMAVWLAGTIINYNADGCVDMSSAGATGAICGVDTTGLSNDMSHASIGMSMSDRLGIVFLVWIIGFVILTGLWFMTRGDSNERGYSQLRRVGLWFMTRGDDRSMSYMASGANDVNDFSEQQHTVPADLVGQLKAVADLKSAGALTDEEFVLAKAKILSDVSAADSSQSHFR